MASNSQIPVCQTLSVGERKRPQYLRKLLLIFAVLLPITWQFASREWDEYAAYSGTVIKKEMHYNYLRQRNGPSLNLYVVLRDQQGKLSTRYVGNDWSGDLRWSDIQVDSFVVKKKGFGEYPRVPGAAPPSTSRQTQAWTATDWVALVCMAILAAFLVRTLRQLWQTV